jgi:N-acetylmuramoyl-L-alanine amidase
VFIEVGGNVNTVAGPAHSFLGNGVPLSHCVIDSTNQALGSYLVSRGGVILIPQQPLQSGVKYVVTLTVNGQPYTWSFTVGPFVGCPFVTASASPPSPSAVGTTVTVSASASACLNPLYEFWTLAPGATSWQLAQPYSTNASFSWSTGGLDPGSYLIAVWARDAGSSGIYGNSSGRWDSYAFITYGVVTHVCTAVSLASAPSGMTGVGSSVNFTAAAFCPDPNPLYEFWTLAPGASIWTLVQAYSTSNTFTWSTAGKSPGTYQVAVWARDASGGGVYSNQFGTWDASGSQSYRVTTCSGLSVASTPASPVGVGGSVNFTATAAGCPHANPIYEFWVLAPGGASYQLMQAYSTTKTFTWKTAGLAPGSYRLSIWARDANSVGAYGNQFGSWDAYNNNLVYTLSSCSSVLVSALPASPSGVGTSVKLTAQASGCPDPNPVYQFWMLPPNGNAYQLVQSYSTNNTATWNTSGLAPGSYRFSVWVRDANSAGAQGNQFGTWDAYNNLAITLN